MVFQPDGRRYEVGTANLMGLVGLQAALELLLEVGVENIAAELLRKRAWLVPALEQKGMVVLQADAPPSTPAASSLFTERARTGGNARLVPETARRRELRPPCGGDRTGRQYLRISAHFYNTDAELHRTLEFL